MLTAAVPDRETTLRVRTPGSAPLGADDPHAELQVTGDDLEVTVTLDGGQLEALTAALAENSLREWGDD